MAPREPDAIALGGGAGDEAVARIADRLAARGIPLVLVADDGYRIPPGVDSAHELGRVLAGLAS